MEDAVDELKRARESFKHRMWMDAFNALSLADETVSLGAEDLELLSTTAYLIGRDDDSLRALDRAHRAHLETGETLGAARAAFWLGFRLIDLGEMAKATGWFGRAARLVEREGRGCVERGYSSSVRPRANPTTPSWPLPACGQRSPGRPD